MTDSKTAPTGAPHRSAGFFGWLRSLGISRGDRWIGGVCGGIAARLRIDPLIVRGIAIVAAVFGAPAFLFYAAAWLLLPDEHGTIHLEDLVHGVFDPVIVAIAVGFALAFTPVSRGVWWLGGHVFYWATPWYGVGSTVFQVLWSLAIVGLVIWLIVWLVNRAHRYVEASRATASTSTTNAESTASAPGEAPAAPAAPPSGATAKDMKAWREQHAAWRAENQQWREQWRDSLRSQRRERSADFQARAEQLRLDALAARDRRRAASPRTSGWFVALALGTALVAGGIAGALALAGADTAAFAGAIGVAAALLVIGVAMLVAGLARRRSGFLAFVAIVLAVAAAGSATAGYGGFSSVELSARTTSFTQIAGDIDLALDPIDLPATGSETISLTQQAGHITIRVAAGVHAIISVEGDSHATVSRFDDSDVLVASADAGHSYTSPGTGRTVYVDVKQQHGQIDIWDQTAVMRSNR